MSTKKKPSGFVTRKAFDLVPGAGLEPAQPFLATGF
jgi:hypothetical protein